MILSFINSCLWSFLCAQLSLNSEIEFQARGVCALHYDGDERCEFLIHKENRFYLTDQHLTTHFQINPMVSGCGFVTCMDIDGEPPKELFFQAVEHESVWVYIYSENELKKSVMVCLGEDNAPPDGWDGAVYNFSLCDLNGDGFKDMVFQVNSGFDLRPRGVYAYDLRMGKEFWHYHIGGSPRDLHVVDVNNDGKEELIFSTTAVANGNTANGFDDDHSYVILLDARGSLVWHRQIGGTLSDLVCWVGDIDNDSLLEVVTAECEGSASSTEANKIYILDAETGETEKYIACGAKFLGFVVHDLNRDEKPDILVGNTDGVIRVFNNELVPIRQRDMGMPSWVLYVQDMNNDGLNEILVRCGENKLCILDENLNTLCDYQGDSNDRIRACCVSDGQRSKLLVYSDGPPPLNYALLNVSGPTILHSLKNTQPPVLFLLIVIFAIGGVLLIQIHYQRRLKKQKESTDGMLEWSGLAQRLAHDIKNPLSTMNLTLQRLQDVGHKEFGDKARVLDTYTDSVLEEVARLRETTDRFMKILSIEKPRIAAYDLEELIETALARFKKRITEDVVIKRIYGTPMPSVLCDRDQIVVVFSNIIENALDALDKKGVLCIRVTENERILKKNIREFVEIEFEDTGRGLSPEDLGRIFEPFFTTKEEGTGIGLVITREIVRRNNGTITITSKENIGTVVNVQLPTAKGKKGTVDG